ncbi:MAG TPA: S53 family peptidase [Thermoanaerobaculia bacterium]|nr:S53 family peptidase [Thermoanaerobaculia bacterium]
MTKLVPLPGSRRRPQPDTFEIGGVDPLQQISVTVVLRQKKKLDLEALRASGLLPLSREDHAARHGAELKDVARVEGFAARHRLTVMHVSLSARTMILCGRTADMAEAFGVELRCYGSPGKRNYREPVGEVRIPTDLAGIVTAVLGLGDRPIRPQLRIREETSADKERKFFTVREVAEAYGFPPNLDGEGQCVGLVELGGGVTELDIAAYCKLHRIDRPRIISAGVDGACNDPGKDYQGDAETSVDLEVMASVVPKALMVVYFAPDTNLGLIDAVRAAVHDRLHKPQVLSISWGDSEATWSELEMRELDLVLQEAAAVGMTVFASAGDLGCALSTSEEAHTAHANFPASSPYAVSCGGTRLTAPSGRISREVVWNNGPHGPGATGGGVSDFFAKPPYQSKVKVPSSPTKFRGRGVPDISGNADPIPGYRFIVRGKSIVGGGTSVVAPLYAGLVTRLNQARHAAGLPPAGFIHTRLYGTPGLCRDVKSGNNDYTGKVGVYQAVPGWNACTGFGSVIGKQWVAEFLR